MHWMVLFGCLVLHLSGCFSKSVRRRDIYVREEQVGYILSDIKTDFVNSSGNQASLGDIEDTFGSNKFTKGKIEAINGSLGDLATLAFFNLSVSTSPNAIVINTLVTMDKFEITYEYFRLSLFLFTVDGQISVSVGRNLLDLTFCVVFEDKCQVIVNGAVLKQFSDIQAKVSSVGGPLDDPLVNKILQMLIKKYESSLQSIVEKKMKVVLEKISDRICYGFE